MRTALLFFALLAAGLGCGAHDKLAPDPDLGGVSSDLSGSSSLNLLDLTVSADMTMPMTDGRARSPRAANR